MEKTKILVVDDDSMNMFVFQDIFMSEDQFDCKYVESGEEALDVLPIFRPDIILLDIMMPGISGYDVCQEIRQEHKYQFIKIIIVSGKGMLEERLKGYDKGADDYLVKPFDKDELLAKINVFKRLKRVEEIESNQSKLLALLSHETKTPMSGILGAIELLLEEDLSDDHASMLKVVHSSAGQLMQFIDKITLYYRLSQSEKTEKQNVNLLLLFDNLLDDLQKQLTKKQITVAWKHRQAINIYADWFYIQIAVKNILENAIKFSPENAEISISIESESDLCKACISDQGPGVPYEYQTGIFEPFGIQDIIHHHKGLGLSLATSRLIFQLHNGDIYCKSEPDNGASFCFQLPINYESNFSNASGEM
jgi:signal transduction histidine kinase